VNVHLLHRFHLRNLKRSVKTRLNLVQILGLSSSGLGSGLNIHQNILFHAKR
jgi:hypothetical protein